MSRSLIIFLHGIGDNIMFTGVIREYKKEHKREKIDLFVLDVEGYELNVLEGLKLSPVLPEIICIEWSDKNRKQITEVLLKMGYSFHSEHYHNLLFKK